jgi:NAD-dependent DNA ligase
MAASSIFPNFGEKRLKLITKTIPNLEKISDSDDLDGIKKQILQIKSFKSLADVFENNLLKFNKWLYSHQEIIIREDPDDNDDINNDTIEDDSNIYTVEQFLRGETIVFSGIRNALLQKQIEKHGGRVVTAVSKQTTILIVKEMDSQSKKVQTAQQNGARVMLITDFADKYGFTI